MYRCAQDVSTRLCDLNRVRPLRGVRLLPDEKKNIEDAVWSFIACHRPLKLVVIAATGIGVVSGIGAALERPVALAIWMSRYVVGATPKPDEVTLERNAFASGMIFREMHLSGPGAPYYAALVERLQRTFAAVGYSDAELSKLGEMEPSKILPAVSLARERFEGHLEQKAHRARAFFKLGYYLRALAEASVTGGSASVREYNSLALSAREEAASGANYRIPSLSLDHLRADEDPPKEYILVVLTSIKQMKAFLSDE